MSHRTLLGRTAFCGLILVASPFIAASCRDSTEPVVPVPTNFIALHLTPTDSIALRLTRELTPWLAEQSADGVFSGVVLVSYRGEPLYAVAYGQADRERGVANALDTRFNLGSMNKTWTAIAVAQLVEQGKVALHAPVGHYLPDLPNQTVREHAQVRHLLTHTSGLGDYLTEEFLHARPYVEHAADYLPYFINDTLAFPPGTELRYSNGGFALLGLLIERVSGQSYWDYVTTNVLRRATMTHAGFVDLRAHPHDVAVGYTRPPDTSTLVANWDFIEPRSSPAGGAYATAADIVAFSRALWSGGLVGFPIVREFTTGKVDTGRGLKYAYGFGEGIIGGWRFVGHNGGLRGGNAEFMSFPEHDIDLVVLANSDPPIATQVARRAASLITGQPLPPAPAASRAPRP